MDKVFANIEILNANDWVSVKKRLSKKVFLKSIKIKCTVDCRVKMLCINEEVRNSLNLQVIEKQLFRMSDNTIQEFDVVFGVIVKFRNRQTCCRAVVLSGNEDVILGMIPFNGLDVKINNQELVINSEFPMVKLPSIYKMIEN
jgi:hypothetical protein